MYYTLSITINIYVYYQELSRNFVSHERFLTSDGILSAVSDDDIDIFTIPRIQDHDTDTYDQDHHVGENTVCTDDDVCSY